MRYYQTVNLFWFSQGSMAEWRNKAWVWGVGEGDRAGLHDVLHHVHLHLWVNTHVENIIKIKPKHHHEEHHDAPHEPHLLCMLEVSWEHPRCLDPHSASHKGLGATFELEVVLVVKLPPLTFLIHKSLNLLFPHFLTHAVLMMNLILTTLFVMDFKSTLMSILILMPTLMMLMLLPLPIFGFLYLHRLRNRWGHPRYIDLMAGCK